VIGGGAAGFFAAIQCASLNPLCEVIILEKSTKLLAKVKVSGGGRCNVTHACFDIKQLVKYYPRGGKELYGLFARFSPESTVEWFESRGVKLKTEEDGRMFPVTDSSQTVIDCLLKEAETLQVKIYSGCQVMEVRPKPSSGFNLLLGDGQQLFFDRILVATGGSPKKEGFDWLQKLGHDIVLPVPSLFTFNITEKKLTSMMGLSVPEATVKIKDQPQVAVSSGPLLITHWGLSGPAILKLSSVAARVLASLDYRFHISVNWTGDKNEEEVRRELVEARKQFPARLIFNSVFTPLPKRLWQYLATRSGIPDTLQWANISKEQLNSLVHNLVRDEYEVGGKTTFKEEFVTCGGVALSGVDLKTMASKKMKGLYFAGEVLDVDALTGGFNFQAAWSGGFVAGTAMAAMR
jgi:predicted Rossmann fold flavoprotein